MPRITEMYAFVAIDDLDDPTDEGICAFKGDDGSWNPMVGADMHRVESYRDLAQVIANVTGQEIKILRFVVREEIGTITPKEAE